MFTGIISGLGPIVGRQKRGQFVVLQIDLAKYELNLGDSVACDGICLTVSKLLAAGICEFEVSVETVNCTNIQFWQVGYCCNIELAMVFGARVDGHFVSGHVDGVVEVASVVDTAGGVNLQVSYASNDARWVRKGSFALNGVSLTINKLVNNNAWCMLVPHTLKNTNLQFTKAGDVLNIEFDMMYKMVSSCCDKYKELASE